MQNARLDDSQVGIKMVRYNINNLGNVDENEKVGLKLNIQKTKTMASSPITANRRRKSGNSDILLFSWAPKSLLMVITAMKIKDACFLEEKL